MKEQQLTHSSGQKVQKTGKQQKSKKAVRSKYVNLPAALRPLSGAMVKFFMFKTQASNNFQTGRYSPTLR